MQIRHGITMVLEWERGMMRDQVGRATGQVREWVMREQRGQLLQQARQLQEEAERFGSKGGLGGDDVDGRGGAEGGRGEVLRRVAARRDNEGGGMGQQQGSRPLSRPIPSSREGYIDGNYYER